MTEYIIVFIISEFFGYLYTISKEYKIILAIMSVLPIMIVSSIRYNVGTDYMMYLSMYRSIVNKTSEFDILGNGYLEIGYYWLESIAAMIDLHYTFIFTVTAVITWGLIFYAIYLNYKNPMFAIYLVFTVGLFSFSLNVVRQSLAIGIIFCAIHYIELGKFWKYTVFIAVASLFHYSSIIFFPIYFLSTREFSRKKIVSFMALSAIAIYYSKDIILELMTYFYYGQKYLAIGGEYLQGELSIGYIAVVVIYLTILFYYYKDLKHDILFNVLLWCQILTLLFLLMTYNIGIVYRVASLFRYEFVLLFPYVLSKIKHPMSRFLLYIITIFVFGGYACNSFLIKNTNEVLPYVSIWD